MNYFSFISPNAKASREPALSAIRWSRSLSNSRFGVISLNSIIKSDPTFLPFIGGGTRSGGVDGYVALNLLRKFGKNLFRNRFDFRHFLDSVDNGNDIIRYFLRNL